MDRDDPPARRPPRRGVPDGWVAAALLLGVAAAAEAVLRAPAPGTRQAVALLAGLAATLALAYAREHGPLVLGCVAAATGLTALVYGWPSVAGLVALVAVAVTQGARHLRRRRARAAERDAASAAMERALRELTARDERARIARELHDVVAHHISMITVQAETARLATPGMPEDGARQLRSIADTARTALTEMRRLLGVLREDTRDAPERAPQPGLAQVLRLVDDTRETSRAAVRLVVRGQVTGLDAGVELAAYRIIQEALTNARRHAPGACVDVELDYGTDELRLRVRDAGPGAAPPADGGHGLRGMRERAAAVGGRLRTESPPSGGFVVEAVLPVERETRDREGERR